MRPFSCPTCRNPVYFENSACIACGTPIGYRAEDNSFVAIPDDGAGAFAYCANHEHCGCNWAVPSHESPRPFCISCDLNELIPPISDPAQRRRWADVELAKRRFVYSVVRLDIPFRPKREHVRGLSFRILVNAEHGGAGDVVMGHQNGVITIDATEADAHLREFRKAELDEVYRTLLGHIRHEAGHYFWERLFTLEGFPDAYRALFGDEREDYGAALARHYNNGPPADWQTRYISAYATSHSWEDWAETFAHYLHIVDGVETAAGFSSASMLVDAPDDPYRRGDFALTLSRWHDIALLMNAMNRSLGHQDYYPFVVTSAVAEKLDFIHQWLSEIRR